MIKFVIASVSASGKTTLVNRAIDDYNLTRLLTCTTREIRPEETGDEYHFLTKENFLSKVNDNQFVEYSKVYENYYGLTKEEVDSNSNSHTIIILDVQGTEKFKSIYPDTVTIFIDPPPRKELLRRLNSRNTNDADVSNRIKMVDLELEHREKFDHIVKYDKLENMIQQLNDIIDMRIYIDRIHSKIF
jgi:guanylate kinase